MGKVPTTQVCGHESESPETRDSRVMQHIRNPSALKERWEADRGVHRR